MLNGDVLNDFTVTSGVVAHDPHAPLLQFPAADAAATVVGDIVSGRIAVPYILPKDAANVTVFLVTRDGLRLTKVPPAAARACHACQLLCAGQRRASGLQFARSVRHPLRHVHAAQLLHVRRSPPPFPPHCSSKHVS